MYLDSFLKYISSTEAILVVKVLCSSVNVDNEEVSDFLKAFDCKKVAMAENFKDLIIEIAHKELEQKPRYACDCWSEILVLFSFTALSQIENISNLSIGNENGGDRPACVRESNIY